MRLQLKAETNEWLRLEESIVNGKYGYFGLELFAVDFFESSWTNGEFLDEILVLLKPMTKL